MAVLITGGTGFIGLSVAEALASNGRKVVLFGPEPLPESFRGAPWLGGIIFIAGDLRTPGDLERAFAAAQVRDVLHAAAVTPDAAREVLDPEGVIAVNVLGTLGLLRCAAAKRRIRRVVVLSSVAIYGAPPARDDVRLEEDAACPRPENLYGISKLAAEQAALRLGAPFGLDIRVVRLGPVFGPWEHRTDARALLSPHAQIWDSIASGEEVVLPRPMRADWLYSRDAGAGIAALLEAPAPTNRIFNLGGEVLTDVAEWCTAIRRQGHACAWRIAERAEEATIATSLTRDRPALDNARIFAETDFRHRFSLAAAAADYIQWHRATAAATTGTAHHRI